MSPCQFLQWDTDFFGQRIGRITTHRLTPQSLAEVLRWCEQEQIACLYFLADADDRQTVRLVEDSRFHFVDARLTLAHKLGAPAAYPTAQDRQIIVRQFAPEDLPALRAMARVMYRDTRYYYDPCFVPELCDALYETWLAKSCEGAADAVWVALRQMHPIGYISCHLSRDTMQGQIGLVGVSPQAQGSGVGKLLLDHTLHWFAVQGMQTVEVVTQARNIAAQRLYQRAGFLTQSLQLWYHKWFTDCE